MRKQESPAGGEASAVGEESNPRLHFLNKMLTAMKGVGEISVFADESGSFDSSPYSSHYYIICFVFHDQSVDISENVALLDRSLLALNLPEGHAVHTGPLVRWEDPYRAFRRQERRIIFARMMAFLRRCDIAYKCFAVDKRFVNGLSALREKLLRQVVDFLASHSDDLNAYEAIKVYYDNGQSEVLHIIEKAFSVFSPRVTLVPDVAPEKYKLFQLADMLATLELIRLKLETDGRISESEKQFFLSIGNLKRNFLKPAHAKEWR